MVIFKSLIKIVINSFACKVALTIANYAFALYAIIYTNQQHSGVIHNLLNSIGIVPEDDNFPVMVVPLLMEPYKILTVIICAILVAPSVVYWEGKKLK